MEPRRARLLPERSHHRPQGRSRTFHADRIPPGFHTIKDHGADPHQPWRDLPPPTGHPPFRLDLKYVLSPEVMNAITGAKRMVFHTVGDTGGVNTPTPQENVESYMEKDFGASKLEDRPAFFYHLGDVVYYDGERQNYYWEFYEPYLHYPAPIFAIPGNHDGDINSDFPAPSLAAFVRNFCAQTPQRTEEAQDAPRDAMTQPNVYWTLLTPLATIIGLYTNCPEGGQLGVNQIAWFENELSQAPTDRALIVALHHPIFSAYGQHVGSQHLRDKLEEACQVAKRTPHLILSGHVHDYQRFSAPLNGKNEVPFVVAGAGGYNERLHVLAPEYHADEPLQMPEKGVVLEKVCDDRHGYLKLTVATTEIQGEYFAVPDPGAAPADPLPAFDTFTVSL